MEPFPADSLVDATDSAVLVDGAALNEERQVESDAGSLFGTAPLVQQGSLTDMTVAAVLGSLWREQASGALLIRCDRVKKIIYLRQGNAYDVRSNRVSECLGQLLVKERMITAEQCEGSIAQMKLTGQQQGEILVRMGAITTRNLEFALELQLESKLFDAFSWTDGDYRFNTTAELPETEVRLEWQGASVVVEGIRRSFDEKRLRQCIAPLMDKRLRWRRAAPQFSTLGFAPPETAAALRLTLPNTPRTLLRSLEIEQTQALRIVYCLMALDLFLAA
jgi:hypothetical protein